MSKNSETLSDLLPEELANYQKAKAMKLVKQIAITAVVTVAATVVVEVICRKLAAGTPDED